MLGKSKSFCDLVWSFQIFPWGGEAGSNKPGEQPRGGCGYHQAWHIDSAADHGPTCHDQQAKECLQWKWHLLPGLQWVIQSVMCLEVRIETK